MSPEYAMNGIFSEKSDVYSFGVLVLEIVSGKRNTGYYPTKHSINLLGFVSREPCTQVYLFCFNNIEQHVTEVLSFLDNKYEFDCLGMEIVERGQRYGVHRCLNG